MSDIKAEAKRLAEVLQGSKALEGTEIRLLTGGEETESLVARPTFLSTQHAMLDIILGGGVPSSRLVELFSANEGAGKSTLCAHLIAEVQRRGGLGVLIDSEHGSVGSRLAQLGVDLEALIYVDPESIEDVLTLVDQLLEEVEGGGVADRTLIVWDSLAATPTKAKMNRSFDDPIQVGEVARTMSAHLPRISRRLAHSKASLVIVNQGRERIGVTYGETTTTSGGKGLKFHAATRIRMDQVTKIKNKEGKIVGVTSEVFAVKNRLAEPYQKVKVNILFSRGIDVIHGFFQALLYVDALRQKGAWCELEGVDKKFRPSELLSVLPSADTDAILEKLIKHGANEEFVRWFLEEATK